MSHLIPDRSRGATRWPALMLCGACLGLGLPQNPVLARTPSRLLATPSSNELLRFEANAGQSDPAVRFVARGTGYGLFLTDSGAVLSLDSGTSARALRLRFDGSAGPRAVVGADPLRARSTYFTGNRRIDAEQFGSVRYREVYPGVDAVFYGASNQLEYDFVIQPGSSPSAIRLAVDGADGVRVDDNGDLRIATGGIEVVQRAPVAYQTIDGQRVSIASRYHVAGDSVGFELGAFDVTRPVVIDPVLNYSTYLGGSGFDTVHGVAVDTTGNLYVVGTTASTDFPTQFGLAIPSRNRDAFVSKIAADGSSLISSTYLGGSDDDEGTAITLGADGSIYVTGATKSADFPTSAGAFVHRGSDDDMFVSKLSSDGRALLVSSVFGGTGIDDVGGIAVDGSGAMYLTGATNSSDFPTQLPLQISSGGGDRDVFVSKLLPTGASLAFSTYLGASGRDDGNAIAVDSSGNVIVTGFTTSTAFPTRRPLQAANAGARDAFVTSINPTGTEINFSTFLGGTFNDVANAIALGADGTIYLTGQTFSDDFPTNGTLAANGGNGDAFLAELDASAANLVFSTFLGGSNEDQGNAIAVDSAGAAYLTGFTASTNFPTKLPLQTETGDSNQDAFVTKINASGTRLGYSTYFGGNDADRGNAIAVDGSGNAYIGGITLSTNLPTQDPILTDRGAEDGFVAKIGNAFSDLALTLSAAPEPVHSNSNLTYTITVNNVGPDSAGNVLVSMSTPTGTTFVSATASAGTCTTPAVGATGTVSCNVGILASGASATLTVVVKVTAGEGATIDATATTTTTATDTNGANNSASVASSVVAPINPPIITSTSKLTDPFKVRIDGSNFQPGVQVFIGADTVAWPTIKVKNTTRITLKGDTLKTKFPKGTAVSIRVVNVDGGEASTTFTR